jgi:hypothetical protein
MILIIRKENTRKNLTKIQFQTYHKDTKPKQTEKLESKLNILRLQPHQT